MIIDEHIQVLDKSCIDRYSGGDAAAARDIYQMFREHTQEDVACLHAAFSRMDTQQIVLAAHRIKGSSQMMGASRQSAIAELIEHAARKGDVEAARGMLPEFEAEHASLMRHMETLDNSWAKEP